MNDWNIQARAHACQCCKEHFVDKQPYRTVLVDEKQGYARLDVCDACWEKQYKAELGTMKGLVSCWQGVYHAPPAAPPDPIQKDTAESLPRKLIERDDPAFAAASYILAVMLERKRGLKIKEQFRREGQRVFVYEQPKTGDIFTIPDPDLQLNQLEEVQKKVGDLLEYGLDGPPPAPGAEEPATTENPETGEPTATVAEGTKQIDSEPTPS